MPYGVKSIGVACWIGGGPRRSREAGICWLKAICVEQDGKCDKVGGRSWGKKVRQMRRAQEGGSGGRVWENLWAGLV